MKIEIIEKAVCRHFGITRRQLRPKSKKEPSSRVIRRQLIYYLTRERNPKITLENIGARYGQNYATVIYAIKTVEGWLESDKLLQSEVKKINDLIEQIEKEEEIKKELRRKQKREWRKKYYQRNKDKMRESDRRWRQENGETVRQSIVNWKNNQKQINLEWCNNCIQL